MADTTALISVIVLSNMILEGKGGEEISLGHKITPPMRRTADLFTMDKSPVVLMLQVG